jgi:hypothetical protein
VAVVMMRASSVMLIADASVVGGGFDDDWRPLDAISDSVSR